MPEQTDPKIKQLAEALSATADLSGAAAFALCDIVSVLVRAGHLDATALGAELADSMAVFAKSKASVAVDVLEMVRTHVKAVAAEPRAAATLTATEARQDLGLEPLAGALLLTPVQLLRRELVELMVANGEHPIDAKRACGRAAVLEAYVLNGAPAPAATA